MEVVKAVRRQSPLTSVIVLTAHASLETAVEALKYGAHDYLFKPVATVDLRESVRTGLLKREQELERNHLGSLEAQATVLNASQSAPADSQPPMQAAKERERFLQYQDLIVDPIRHVVTVGDKLLDLSPTEFNLLAYLVAEFPRVVPPKELVQEVQGYASETWEASETLRSHIYHIRHKTRALTGRDLIRNVHGVGYTLSS